MRKTVYALIGSLVPEGVPVIAAASLNQIPDTRPFVVIRTAFESPEAGTKTRSVEVWVHDVYGSYIQIDKILHDIQDGLRDMDPFAGDDGIISVMDFQNGSPDLTDDKMNTICRSNAFKIVGQERPEIPA